MTDAPKISAIIAVYNGARHLEEQIDAMLAQRCDFPWEVIYVDNGSTDGSRDIIRRRIETLGLTHVRLLDGSQARGQVYARNYGAAAARADRLAFTDQDDHPTPTWLAEIDKALDHADATGGYTIPGTFGYPLGPVPDRREPPKDYVLTCCGFEWAPGNNVGIHRHVFEGVGRWQDIGIYAGEDVDLWIRLQLKGYRITRAMEAQVFWRARQFPREILRQSIVYGRSEVLVYVRYRHLGAKRRDGWGMLRMFKKALVTWGGWFEQPRSYMGFVVTGALIGRIYESFRSRVLYI